MDFDAEIRVDIENRQAKTQERDLMRTKRESQRKESLVVTAGRRLASPLRSRLGLIVGGIGGYNAVSRVTKSYSDVDPWEVALSPYLAAVNQTIDSAFGGSAIGDRRAREATVNAFAELAGNHGVEVAAREFYQASKNIMTEQERGRQILRQDPALQGPDLATLLANAFWGYFKLLGASFDYLLEKFTK